MQIPKITTAPPSDTLAKDGAAPNTAAAVSLDSQSPVRIAGQFEVRIEDLAVYPPLEAALGQSMQGSLSVPSWTSQTFNGAAGELNGLFVQAAECHLPRVRRKPTRPEFPDSLRWLTGNTPTPSRTCEPSSAAKLSRSMPEFLPTPTKAKRRLFDYLVMHLGSIRVSDRVPGVSSVRRRRASRC